jgi:nucleoside-diphosphate-sugar epimerase
VTGGAGYIGAATCRQLLEAGHHVRVLDALLHGQHDIADGLRAAGADVHVGDVRDAAARRRALTGVDAVVHLAAIVGDPACAEDPALAHAVNVDASTGLIADADALGVERLIFASTCSNYGRMADPTVPIDERGTLAPVSLYAEQKVQVERRLLEDAPGALSPTCLRFATIYGIAPRMRFDLTVNEFTRDLWAGRTLEVFGERFWRPYVHVTDAARAVRLVLESPLEHVGGATFNVGSTSENYRKLDLVCAIRRQTDAGHVAYVTRAEDPRDYKVDFTKAATILGYTPHLTVADGIRELLAALAGGTFPDPWDRRHRNSS